MCEDGLRQRLGLGTCACSRLLRLVLFASFSWPFRVAYHGSLTLTPLSPLSTPLPRPLSLSPSLPLSLSPLVLSLSLLPTPPLSCFLRARGVWLGMWQQVKLVDRYETLLSHLSQKYSFEFTPQGSAPRSGAAGRR